MKVYLLLTDDGRRLFYSEGPEHADDHVPEHHGLRGWFERKARRMKSAWMRHSEHGVAAKLNRVWSWLQRRTFADESLLVRLRSAPAVAVHHPASLSSQEVRDLWEAYVSQRKRRHLPWFAVNALISPLTIVLAPLPGPNIIGYWFAYRAVRHLLALLGLRRVQANRMALTFHPDPMLDQPVGQGGRAGRVIPEGDGVELDEFLRRSGVPGASEADAPGFRLAAIRQGD